MDSRSLSIMSLLLPTVPTPTQPHVGFAYAAVRHGEDLACEHEWLRLDPDAASGFETRDAQVRVLPGHCMAIAGHAAIQVELVIEASEHGSELIIGHDLAGASAIEVQDAAGVAIRSADADEPAPFIRMAIPAGSVRVVARLEQGSRLQVRAA
jgi:hypothetical protein